MAAYDLQVQKPGMLAIPDSGAGDLAAFLSNAENNRANAAREKISQKNADWLQGADGREKDKLMKKGDFLRSAPEQYLNDLKAKTAVKEENIKRLRELYPNAPEEFFDAASERAVKEFNKTPANLISRQEFQNYLNNTALSNAIDLSEGDLSSVLNPYYSPQQEVNPEILKARLGVVDTAGLLDDIGTLGTSGSGGSGGKSGSSGANETAKEFREGRDYGFEITDGRSAGVTRGSPGLIARNTWGKNNLYGDDVEKLFSEMQTNYGISPQFVGDVLNAISIEGELPEGYTRKDLTDPKSPLFKNILNRSFALQEQFQKRGSGAGGRTTDLGENLELYRELQNQDTKTKLELIQEIQRTTQSRSGPLSLDERFRVLADKKLAEEFGLDPSVIDNYFSPPQPQQQQQPPVQRQPAPEQEEEVDSTEEEIKRIAGIADEVEAPAQEPLTGFEKMQETASSKLDALGAAPIGARKRLVKRSEKYKTIVREQNIVSEIQDLMAAINSSGSGRMKGPTGQQKKEMREKIEALEKEFEKLQK